MKDWLATPPERLEINRKHMHPYSVPNIQVWVFLTNHDDAIALEDGDRRFWVHKCDLEAPESEAYYTRLYDWFDARGAAACVGWLLDRDVSKFKPRRHRLRPRSKPCSTSRNLHPCDGFATSSRKAKHFANRTVLTAGELVQRF
jgi:hypothetical protein